MLLSNKYILEKTCPLFPFYFANLETRLWKKEFIWYFVKIDTEWKIVTDLLNGL